MAKFPDWAKKYCTNLWLSIKVVFSRIQVFFGISWILLIGASYLSNANYTIKAILWISFCFLLIYRFLCAIALTNRHTEAYKTLIRIEHVFILISLIGLIILGWFISYSSESVMGAVIILAVSYGVYCCSFSESRRIKFGLTNILLFMFGFFSSRLGHLLFRNVNLVQTVTNTVFKYILPITDKGNTTWLSWGMPLFAGCLIIINWHKERPCPNWNPYTVQEIGLSDHVIRYAIIFISSLFYCCISNMKRAPILPIMGLLLVDVYALYLKNGQDLYKIVCRKVLIAQKVETLIYCIITEDRKAKHGCDFDAEVLNRIENFSHFITKVTSTILSTNNKANIIKEDYLCFLNSIYAKIPVNNNVYNTFGFLIGLSSSIASPNSLKMIKLSGTDDNQPTLPDSVSINHTDSAQNKGIESQAQISDCIVEIQDQISDDKKNFDAFFSMITCGTCSGRLKQKGAIDISNDRDLQRITKRLGTPQQLNSFLESLIGKEQLSTTKKITIPVQRIPQEDDSTPLVTPYGQGQDLIMANDELYPWLLKWIFTNDTKGDVWGWIDELWTKII